MHLKPSILPRQGEVAPQASEGEDTEQTFPIPPPPSGFACHLPLAGEDHPKVHHPRTTSISSNRFHR
jgi:hypothetical protein